MTLWQDQPPQTRRQARESERANVQQRQPGQMSQQDQSSQHDQTSQHGHTSRRAATAGPTAAGDIPTVATSFDGVLTSSDESAQTPEVFRPEQPTDTDVPITRPVAFLPSARSAVPAMDYTPPLPSATPAEPAAASPEPPVIALPGQAGPEITAPETGSKTPDPNPDPGREIGGPKKTLTRRELRAMLQAQEANGRAGSPEPAGEQDAVPDADTASAAPIAHRESFVSAPPGQTDPGQTDAERTDAERTDAEQTDLGPTGLVPDAGATESKPYQPPVGHWSNTADHERQDSDRVISRNVGGAGAPTTASALILPSIPRSGDVGAPLTSTGEILVTGSIDVPHSFATSGRHPSRFDSADMDRLLDQSEADSDTGNAAPIRASRAVSTHTSTRGMIAPPKRRNGALPTILAITAGVLALGVVGLFFAAYVLRIF